MEKALSDLVWKRAQSRCEYCHLPQLGTRLRFHIEHIVAQQHQGQTNEGNLALACPSCNLHKGPNLAGIDPQSNERIWLFNPRENEWEEHFEWVGVELSGKTSCGRTTIHVLAINKAVNLDLRRTLIEEGIAF